MTETEIEAIILRELGLERQPGDAPLAYGETLGWDSASHMNVILALEDALGRQFDADEIVRMVSVGAIAGVINGAANGQASGGQSAASC